LEKYYIKKEIIQNKINIINYMIKNLNNKEIFNPFEKYEENGNIDELLDLNNIKKEITDGKILKYEKKKRYEIFNLYNFVSTLLKERWTENF
jgi:hypothetical protein